MRLSSIYATVAVAALIIAMTYLRPLWMHTVSPSLINPESAQQFISINDVKKLLVELNESLSRINSAKLTLMVNFLNATQEAYSIGQSPPVNTGPLINIINEYVKNGYVSSSLIQSLFPSIPLINASGLGSVASIVKSSLKVNVTGLVKSATAQYLSVVLGNSSNQLISTLAKYAGINITVLTINLNSSSALVGSGLLIYGKLTLSNGTGLPNEPILILIGGKPVSTTVTNVSGYYEVNITVPYIYSNETTVRSVFIPLSSRLIGSTAEATLRLIHNETKVVIHVSNHTVTWGNPLVLWGNVNGPSGRLIIVKASNLLLNTTTGIGGFFNITIPTAPLKPGLSNITIIVKPYLSYGPVNYTISINVTGVKPMITVKFPTLFPGSTNEATVTVKPWIHPIPLSITSPNGLINESLIINEPTVKVPVKVPITQGSGLITLNVTIGPNPPVMESSIAVKVPVVNVLQLAVVALVTPITLLGVRVVRGRRRVKAIGVGTRSGEALVKAIERAAPSARLSNPNVKAIVGALAKAIDAVSSRTGVNYTGVETLREYLSKVTGVADEDTVKSLRGLVAIAEEALYSPKLPTSDDVERALGYLSRVVGK